LEFVIFWFLCGIVSAIVASNKGRSGCGWFLLGILLGPIGVVLALVVSKDTAAVEHAALDEGAMKKCLYCAELIRSEAIKCRFCGSEVLETRALAGNTSEVEGNCPNCDALLPIDSKSCRQCGATFPSYGDWKVIPRSDETKPGV
jgi:ribosomal protein L40E